MCWKFVILCQGWRVTEFLCSVIKNEWIKQSKLTNQNVIWNIGVYNFFSLMAQYSSIAIEESNSHKTKRKKPTQIPSLDRNRHFLFPRTE